MTTRRDFLRTSVATLAALAASKVFAAAPTHRIGVQLYTVRDQAEKDLPGVLKQIAEIGYKEVEPYWNVYSHPAPELRKMVEDLGMSIPSGHFDYDGFESKLDYAHQLGVTYMVCPMLPQNMWTSLDGFQKAADQFNKWGQIVRQRGMKFAFHNHNYEFRDFGGTTGFQALLVGTDPKLVYLEMDCYWITQAGRDPVKMLHQHGDRIRLLHLKDRKPGFPPSHQLDEAAFHFTEVGSGTLDWKDILATAAKTGVEHYFVERDSGDLPAMESLRISYRNLQKIMA